MRKSLKTAIYLKIMINYAMSLRGKYFKLSFKAVIKTRRETV